MKILTINCVHKVYSTGKLIEWIDEYTREKYGVEYLHCYEVGEDAKQQDEYRTASPFWFKVNCKISELTGWLYGCGMIHTELLCNRIKKYNPDIVHVHCPNARTVNLYRLFSFLKKCGYPTVITNHAEFYYTGNCSYAETCIGYLTGCTKCENSKLRHTHSAWVKMKKAFENFGNLTMVAVSPWQEKRIKTSVIAQNINVKTIYNGVDTAIFCERSNMDLQGKYKYRKNIIHVTARFSDDEDDLKGGWYIMDLAKKFTSYNFIVLGWVAGIKSNIPNNLFLLDYIGNQDKVAEYFSLADLSVMTSRRETFGMALAESLCCGTPVVGFKNGGSDSSALTEFTEFVEYGDIDALGNAIEKWIDRKEDLKDELIKQARETYSKERMGEEYMSIYREMLGER